MKRPLLGLILSLLGCAVLRAAPAAPSSATAGSLDSSTVLVPRGGALPGGHEAGGGGPGGTSAMIAVVLLGVAGGWMLWLKVRRTNPIGGGGQKLQIEETRSLGNRQFLVVAAYQNRKFLLGVCPGKIDLLSPLDGDPAAERPKFPL